MGSCCYSNFSVVFSDSTIGIQRLLQRKRHIKIEVCVKSSVLRLFHVGYVLQKRQCALSVSWHEWFSYERKE